MTRARIFLIFMFVLFASILFFLLRKEHDLSRYADDMEKLVSEKSIEANMKQLAAKPHRAGSPENHSAGDRIIQQLRAAGASVWTTEYEVDLPDPGKGSLTMTYPKHQQISYYEKAFEADPYSQIASSEQPFFAYIPNSDVEAEVIYANFGDRSDYRFLKDQGISVAGKIAVVRSQGSCRGMKQMVAEEEGLAGLLLYPEMKDQGFRKKSYPQGPHLNDWVAQRGSMLKFFIYPGDPSSSFPDHVQPALPKVPALPITPNAAKVIMQELGGPVIKEWLGWMDVPYGSGPGPARVRMEYKSSRRSNKIRNIFAAIGGANPGDPVLMVSSHYDAWIYGASDPVSGTATVLEASRALFALEKEGWKPKQSIVFAFWDAEEYGMIGSTRWVWENLDQARNKIGTLIYVDSIRGPVFKGHLLPGLRGVLDEVLELVHDPNTEKLLSDFHVQHDMPGFSDDTIPFQNLAGVPVAFLNFGLHYSMYHSIYDNLKWMEEFGDPQYRYASALARVIALYSIALTREDRLAFRFSEFGEYYKRELSKILLERSFSENITRQIRRSITDFEKVAETGKVLEKTGKLPDTNRQQINELMLKAIIAFTDRPGRNSIPFRLRNMLSGPSVANECGGIALPALQRALQEENEIRVETEVKRLILALAESKAMLQQAASLLQHK